MNDMGFNLGEKINNKILTKKFNCLMNDVIVYISIT
jgi:hypothetical protein